MCTNPTWKAGYSFPISCRVCWQCRERRKADWVGRCLAEKQTSPFAHVVTLTYGGDDYYRSQGVDNLHAQTLIFDDVRNWLKRVRKHVPLRYLLAGELGDRKGRAHWHVLCFWPNEPVPGIRLRERYLHEVNGHALWQHGFSYWDDMDITSIRYTTGYILKEVEQKPGAMQHFSLSTKPILGFEYFKKLAWRHVEDQLSPQDFLYRFKEAVRRDRTTPLEFYMGRTAGFWFLHYFIQYWRHKYANDNWPQSDIVDEHIDTVLLMGASSRPIEDDLHYRWMKSEGAKGNWHGAVNRTPQVNRYLEVTRGIDVWEAPKPKASVPLVTGSSKTLSKV